MGTWETICPSVALNLPHRWLLCCVVQGSVAVTTFPQIQTECPVGGPRHHILRNPRIQLRIHLVRHNNRIGRDRSQGMLLPNRRTGIGALRHKRLPVLTIRRRALHGHQRNGLNWCPFGGWSRKWARTITRPRACKRMFPVPSTVTDLPIASGTARGTTCLLHTRDSAGATLSA